MTKLTFEGPFQPEFILTFVAPSLRKWIIHVAGPFSSSSWVMSACYFQPATYFKTALQLHLGILLSDYIPNLLSAMLMKFFSFWAVGYIKHRTSSFNFSLKTPLLLLAHAAISKIDLALERGDALALYEALATPALGLRGVLRENCDWYFKQFLSDKQQKQEVREGLDYLNSSGFPSMPHCLSHFLLSRAVTKKCLSKMVPLVLLPNWSVVIHSVLNCCVVCYGAGLDAVAVGGTWLYSCACFAGPGVDFHFGH